MQILKSTITVGVEQPFVFLQTSDTHFAPTEDVLATDTPWQIYEQKADEQTLETCRYIRSQPLIQYVICGHLHLNHETQDPNEIKQIVTGLDTLREITVI